MGRPGPCLHPSPGFQIEFGIEFADAAIGTQHKLLDMANGAFVRELSDCRTFCTLGDVEDMHAAGLAKGGNMQNALVVDGDDILTPGGARRADEAVRHKMLDALGDLALAGAPLRGQVQRLQGRPRDDQPAVARAVCPTGRICMAPAWRG